MSDKLDPNSLHSSIAAYREAATRYGEQLETGDTALANKYGELASSLFEKIKAEDPPVQRQLILLFDDPSPAVRYYAAINSGEVGLSGGEAVLEALATDSTPTVIRHFAMRALRQLRTGSPY